MDSSRGSSPWRGPRTPGYERWGSQSRSYAGPEIRHGARGTRLLFVSGLAKGLADRLPEVANVLLPSFVAKAAECRGRGGVLVLGPEALTKLTPEWVRRALRSPLCIGLAVVDGMDPDLIARWKFLGGVDLVIAEALEARVAEARAIPLRRLIPLTSWAPKIQRGREFAKNVLAAIPTLLVLESGALAEALSLERHRLADLCRDAFDKSPSALIEAYQWEYVDQRLKGGAMPQEVSWELGYANSANLLRALARAKRVMPCGRRRRKLPR